jgi:hypothetical protein
LIFLIEIISKINSKEICRQMGQQQRNECVFAHQQPNPTADVDADNRCDIGDESKAIKLAPVARRPVLLDRPRHRDQPDVRLINDN